MLHPCKTSEIMHLLLSCSETDDRPLSEEDAEDSRGSVPDIDDVLEAGSLISSGAVTSGIYCLGENASDKALLGYLEGWIRVVAPVVGLSLAI